MEVSVKVRYSIINSSGASLYGETLKAKEINDTVEPKYISAITIAKRLQDPLSELITGDPKTLSIGQYQHDISKKRLDKAVRDIIEHCVCYVGVDLNTASEELLRAVNGINKAIAKSIVNYKKEKGRIENLKELMKIKGFGKKTFIQCSGFLRVFQGEEPLDSTGIHPNYYSAAYKFLEKMGYTEDEIRTGKTTNIEEKLKGYSIEDIAKELNIGVLTLNDIIKEVKYINVDPRGEITNSNLKSGIKPLLQLKKGMILKGIVTNVVDFGIFVDIGAEREGFVHISQISNVFVKHPLDIVKIGDNVRVRVVEVDDINNKIKLSMK